MPFTDEEMEKIVWAAESIRVAHPKIPEDRCAVMRAQGYLQPGWSGMVHWSRREERFASVSIEAADGQITLRYKTCPRGDEWQHRHYPVAVEWMPCPFGGNSIWFAVIAANTREKLHSTTAKKLARSEYYFFSLSSSVLSAASSTAI
jgi:hypothetical protein